MVHHILWVNNIAKILSLVFNHVNIGWKQSFMSYGILLAMKVVYADFAFPQSLYLFHCSFWNSVFGEIILFKLFSTWIYVLQEVMN